MQLGDITLKLKFKKTCDNISNDIEKNTEQTTAFTSVSEWSTFFILFQSATDFDDALPDLQCEPIETRCQQQHYADAASYPVTQHKSNLNTKVAQVLLSLENFNHKKKCHASVT